MFLWFIWDIIFRIFCRGTVLSHIGSQEREVAVMSWPYPVISFATKLSNVLSRNINQAHIFYGFIFKQHIALADEHLRYLSFYGWILSFSLFGNFFSFIGNDVNSLARICDISHSI